MGKKLLGTTRECFSTRKRAIDLRHERTECEHSSKHLTIDSDRQGTDWAEEAKDCMRSSLCFILFHFERNWGEFGFVCLMWASDKLVL